MKAMGFTKSKTTKKSEGRRRLRLDPKSVVIAVLSLLLWSTNRRRRKPDFQTSGRSDMTEMIPSLVGITEGAIDRGNRVEIIHNGRFFDRLLEDIAAASQSIHIEIAQEWTGDAQDKDHWRDTAARMEGPVVNTLQGVFCENWIEETGMVPVGEKYFPQLEPVGDVDAHVAFTSPRGSISSVQLLYYLAISASEHELIIQNPYFLPHADAIAELEAAVKRGVDVQILLPAAGVIDLPSVQHASHHHYGDLLESGVRIFEYQPTLIHQKIMIVDGIWSCVGSTNFDDRSFDLNDEITVGFTDPDIARQLREAYVEDLKRAKEVHLAEWKKRPWMHKLLDASLLLGRREL